MDGVQAENRSRRYDDEEQAEEDETNMVVRVGFTSILYPYGTCRVVSLHGTYGDRRTCAFFLLACQGRVDKESKLEMWPASSNPAGEHQQGSIEKDYRNFDRGEGGGGGWLGTNTSTQWKRKARWWIWRGGGKASPNGAHLSIMVSTTLQVLTCDLGYTIQSPGSESRDTDVEEVIRAHEIVHTFEYPRYSSGTCQTISDPECYASAVDVRVSSDAQISEWVAGPAETLVVYTSRPETSRTFDIVL
ncbi:hypothetical protein BDP55DRAFT_625855 [Colletotrichum godetiae]|uniref:Uncharacterized protein n=1 Tax=Colletotrichum godetiae TaxID=1209918 RepID=A0AAJ0AYQ9_9PEZI|nr:uncharacterized protein BDP55DRAFT_625855 [Colletotrichum godetiae]KAK1700256.1 hypothetical protein BDP55DRAFT_625855 [Colletotrichum godetiae]